MLLKLLEETEDVDPDEPVEEVISIVVLPELKLETTS
jgi:hypothetical protein